MYFIKMLLEGTEGRDGQEWECSPEDSAGVGLIPHVFIECLLYAGSRHWATEETTQAKTLPRVRLELSLVVAVGWE